MVAAEATFKPIIDPKSSEIGQSNISILQGSPGKSFVAPDVSAIEHQPDDTTINESAIKED